MTAYYNEFDPYTAEWLRNLIREGLIAPGDVDERSIVEVHPDDLRGYTQCHFFAGIGGWSLALRMAGWSDERPVWSGSCPCQPFSAAGRGEGERDERHLWPELRRLAAQCRPPVVFGEQVASRLGRGWLSGVRADLETLGYAAGAADLCAAGVGAPHIRQRLWWVAESDGQRPRIDAEALQAWEPEFSGDRGGVADDGGAGRGWARSAGYEAGAGAFRVGAEEPGRCGGPGGVAYGEAGRWGEVDPQRGGRAEGGGAEHARLRAEDERRKPAGAVPETAGRGEHGGWDSALWLPCADGKTRRIEPGLEPLAHGVSGRVAVERTRIEAGAAVQETHWYNRVGALRGFGNAIVPEVAAAFIRAYLEST